ncbi:hypothetical protein OSTOST_20427 [Ostertagia ostertagi]
MNSLAAEHVDEETAARDRQIVAAVIFMIALPGVICNALVAMFTRSLPTLNNSFGRLTASQATGEIVCCCFIRIPLCAHGCLVSTAFIETDTYRRNALTCLSFHSRDIGVMKEYSHYVGLILLICYDICIYSHLIIALNRLSAINCPLSYSVHFSNRNTTILIIAIWTVSIIAPCALHGRRICSLSYSDPVYTYIFNPSEFCGQLWYVDFIQDVIIVILIAIIDTITIIKYRLSTSTVSNVQVNDSPSEL